MKKVIIIGAGIGGLATANLLAKKGYTVSIYEKNNLPGGKAGTFTAEGFTFDTGPSWYLMPGVFEHYFELLGEDIADHLSLQRLDPAYKIFYQDHPEPVTIHADISRDSQTFENIEAGSGRRLIKYLDSSKLTYNLAIQNFLYTNFENKKSLVSVDIIKHMPRLLSALLTPIDKYVGKSFMDDRLKQILEYPMVFLGTSPYEAPAMYSLMSHMDFSQGVYYPKGGIYTIIEALCAIGRNLGVDYHYDVNVQSINSGDGIARSISLEGGEIVEADIIISNADLHFTETQLLKETDQSYPQKFWDKRQAGPSALLMYLGVRGELPELTHHNLLFTKDWKSNFEAIFHAKTWEHPASIYVCKPSETDNQVAPKGSENVFVLVPAPAKTGMSDKELHDHASLYIDQIAEMAQIPDLKQRISYQKFIGPDDFARDHNAWNGTALGLSHTLMQSALFRPANRSKKLENLYYVGANTTPGIGLPMCLIGAELIVKRLTGDTSTGPLIELGESA